MSYPCKMKYDLQGPGSSDKRRTMPRKAEPSSRRLPRRKKQKTPPQPASNAPQKMIQMSENALDSDFGLALALGPALRRRPDA